MEQSVKLVKVGGAVEYLPIISDFVKFVPRINVCAVNWDRLAHYEYQIAAERNTFAVGGFIAKTIRQWKLPLVNVTLVGHSLGAHISGIVGQALGGKIARIYGKLLWSALCSNGSFKLLLFRFGSR